MTNAITSDREPPATEKLLERVNTLTATTEQMRGELSKIRAGIDPSVPISLRHFQ